MAAALRRTAIALRRAAGLCLSLLMCAAAVAVPRQTVLLWPSGAPGSEGRTESETERITDLGEHVISNVHAPSINVFLPSHDKATGTAVIVIPGGGHTELWMDHGELAALAGMAVADDGAANSSDPVERESARPRFQALIYPAIPQRSLKLTPDTPPAFLLGGAADQPAISQGLADLYLALRRAGTRAELHLYDGVGHGFGIRAGNTGPVAAWPTRFLEWLDQQGLAKRRLHADLRRAHHCAGHDANAAAFFFREPQSCSSRRATTRH